MNYCDRCDITMPEDTAPGSWCQDCLDVEGVTRPTLHIVRGPRGRREIRVGRFIPTSPAQAAERGEKIRALAAEHTPILDIAVQLGISTRTVERHLHAERKTA